MTIGLAPVTVPLAIAIAVTVSVSITVMVTTFAFNTLHFCASERGFDVKSKTVQRAAILSGHGSLSFLRAIVLHETV